MMYEVDKSYPVWWYKNQDSKRWKIKVNDLMIKNEGADSYMRVDDQNTGVHTADAFVDSFYRSVLIPTSVFPQFMQMVDKSFNKSGPAKGLVECSDAAKYGNCWVYNLTCANAKASFRDVLIEFSDSRAYSISPDNYLYDVKGPSHVDERLKVDYCGILIERNNIPDHTNEYVLGTVFMYNYYLVFDFEGQ